jgi:hypothetical protein
MMRQYPKFKFFRPLGNSEIKRQPIEHSMEISEGKNFVTGGKLLNQSHGISLVLY